MSGPAAKPPAKRVRLDYTGRDLVFEGQWSDTGQRLVIDSGSKAGPSPMDALLLSLAACMAIDVRMILEKSRVPLSSLTVYADGRRRTSDPRRFVEIGLWYVMDGPQPDDAKKVQRAIDLSREKYCSVLHSLDPDIALAIHIGDPPPLPPQ